jgi:hypothetical protein
VVRPGLVLKGSKGQKRRVKIVSCFVYIVLESKTRVLISRGRVCGPTIDPIIIRKLADIPTVPLDKSMGKF